MPKCQIFSVMELKASQDKLTQLNSELSTVQERFSDAASAHNKIDTLILTVIIDNNILLMLT